MLSIEQLAAGYGEIRVLHDVSLEVGAGQVVALLGANGAGKTHACFALAVGLLRASAGRIVLNGDVLNRVPAHQIVQRGLIMVPEGRALFPFMTVEENLELGSYAKRASSERSLQSRSRLSFVAATEGAAATARGLAKWRRAADVRDRPRIDGVSGNPGARRAFARTGSRHRSGYLFVGRRAAGCWPVDLVGRAAC